VGEFASLVDEQFILPPNTYVVPFPTQDHGLFVSGLIKAVAPGSDIVLYPVLNKQGLGNLFMLDHALYSFITDTLDAHENDQSLKGAVINLSLGSPIWAAPDPPGSLGIPSEQWPELEEVTSLKTLLSAAACHNFIVVAAAGNAPGGWQVPADFPGVIDVMASTLEGEKACYSNEGQIAAPGGGPPGDGITDLPSCLSDMKTLYDACGDREFAEQQPLNCSALVISQISQSEEFPAGYAYGAGTSFSAPLVSGLAALIQEAGWSPEVGDWIPRDVIEESIMFTTHHNGIIDVPYAVQRSLEILNSQ
jgi:subtilisin family serine protease